MKNAFNSMLKFWLSGYPPKARHLTGVCHSFDARNLGLG